MSETFCFFEFNYLKFATCQLYNLQHSVVLLWIMSTTTSPKSELSDSSRRRRDAIECRVQSGIDTAQRIEAYSKKKMKAVSIIQTLKSNETHPVNNSEAYLPLSSINTNINTPRNHQKKNIFIAINKCHSYCTTVNRTNRSSG